MEKKTSEIQLKMVENRLSRLEFEEQRARDKIQKARLKAELLQRQREQMERENEAKRQRKEMKRKDLERLRQENTLARLRMREHIQSLQELRRGNFQNYTLYILRYDFNYELQIEINKKKLRLKEEISQARKYGEQLIKEEDNYKIGLKNKVKGDKTSKKTIRLRMKTYT